MHGHADAALTAGAGPVPSRWAFAEVVAPLPLAAAALMAVNDVWLKPTFHNELTGKLSDLAVCFLLPLYLSALLALVLPRLPLRTRLMIGAVVTTVLFTALELSTGVAAAFCRANLWVGGFVGIDRPCRLTLDLTDLLTLVMVPLAHVYAMARLPSSGVSSRRFR